MSHWLAAELSYMALLVSQASSAGCLGNHQADPPSPSMGVGAELFVLVLFFFKVEQQKDDRRKGVHGIWRRREI